MSSVRKRKHKRNYEIAQTSLKEAKRRRSVPAGPGRFMLTFTEQAPSLRRTALISPRRCWQSSIAHNPLCYCVLTESKEFTDSYVNLGYRTSTLPNETPPLNDLIVNTASLYVSTHRAPHRPKPSNPRRGDVIR